MLHRDDSVRSQIQHHQLSLPQTGNNIIQNTIGLQVKLLYMHGSKDHLSSHSRGLQISLEGPARGYKLYPGYLGYERCIHKVSPVLNSSLRDQGSINPLPTTAFKELLSRQPYSFLQVTVLYVTSCMLHLLPEKGISIHNMSVLSVNIR